MKLKKFIRFVCVNEKVKCRNIVTKVYDDDDNFLYIKKPFVFALSGQSEVDIDMIKDKVQIDVSEYDKLHHFKNDNGSIVKKSDTEIETIEAEMAQRREDKKAESDIKVQEKADNEAIINDDAKSDKDKITALIKLYKG